MTTGLFGLGVASASASGALGVVCTGAASMSDGSDACLSMGLGASAVAGSGNGTETAIQIQSAIDDGIGNVVTYAPKTFTVTSIVNGILIAAGNRAVAEGPGATAIAGSDNGGGTIAQVQSVVLTGNDNTVTFAPQTATALAIFDGISISVDNTAVANGAGAFASAGSNNEGILLAQLQATSVSGSDNTVTFAPQNADVSSTFTGISVAIGNSAVANGAGSIASAGSFNSLLGVVLSVGNSAQANGPGSVAISGSGDSSPLGVVLAIGNSATANGTGAVALAGSFTNGGIDNTATATASSGSIALAAAGSG